MRLLALLCASATVASACWCGVAAADTVKSGFRPVAAPPTLLGASQILAKLPALVATDAMNYGPSDPAFFGAETVMVGQGVSKMVPDEKRLTAWKETAKSYRKAGGAPSAAAWLQLEARRVALLAPAPKADEEQEPKPTPSLVPGFESAVNILPAPDQWRALLQGARKIYDNAPDAHNAAVYYFAARLNADNTEMVAALRALYRIGEPQFRADMATKTPEDSYGGTGVRQLALERDKALAELLAKSPDPAQQKQGLRWQLQLGELLTNQLYIDVPDLVARWGEAQAREFLPEILRSSARIQWYGAGKTVAVAREVWLANPALQRAPLWDLARAGGDYDVPFSLALLQKFAPKKGDSGDDTDAYNYRNVQLSVVQALVKRGEFSRASDLMARWNREGWVNAEFSFYLYDNNATREQQSARLDWIEQTVARYPVLNWWSAYRDLALRSGESARAIDTLNLYLARPVANKGAIKSALGTLYLDEGEIEMGGALLAAQVEVGTRGGNDIENLQSNIASLLRLTRVAPHLKWLKIARAGAQNLANKPLNEGNSERQIRQIADIALQLHEQNQSVFAQQLLANALVAASQPPKERYYGAHDTRSYLYALITIYRDAGRAYDALYLLENARGWGTDELTPLLDYRGEGQWDSDKNDIDFKARTPLGELAAWALYKNNRRAQAAQVARATLERDAGNDGVYALLIDIEGQQAVPFLKQLAARDPYEERPLIWQAELARRARDLSRATQLAERAIAVDPSDGEQPRGDRLRAYSTLAAIRRAQNNDAKANELAEAVKAIRLSETADKWRVAGVAPRAIALYRQSLRLFDNAYCVQSRLAVELTSQGEFEQAAQHFERAYQLMPVSFGRMESHCFGCEGVFGNAKTEPIAQRVFRQLETAQPNNPKVQYLAGYWRMSAGQYQQSTRYFQRAVALDPLYLSAWQKLKGNTRFLTPLEQDSATLAVLRLDPSGQHDDYGQSFEINRDFRGLWEVTEAVLPRIRPNLKANFKLPKSSDSGGDSYGMWELVTSPANAIARQNFMRSLSALAR